MSCARGAATDSFGTDHAGPRAAARSSRADFIDRMAADECGAARDTVGARDAATTGSNPCRPCRSRTRPLQPGSALQMATPPGMAAHWPLQQSAPVPQLSPATRQKSKSSQCSTPVSCVSPHSWPQRARPGRRNGLTARAATGRHRHRHRCAVPAHAGPVAAVARNLTGGARRRARGRAAQAGHPATERASTRRRGRTAARLKNIRRHQGDRCAGPHLRPPRTAVNSSRRAESCRAAPLREANVELGAPPGDAVS